MPAFVRELEDTLHNALKQAEQRNHEYATLEHLLIALVDDVHASRVMSACGVDRDELRKAVKTYIDTELSVLDVSLIRAKKRKSKEEKERLAVFDKSGPTPTAGFQRVVQRSILHVQSSGRDEINGANVLVALFSERDSYAVHFLTQQDMSRLDAVTYMSHGVAKGEPDTPVAGQGETSPEARERINRVFRDDLKVVSDVIPHTPVLTTPKIAEKITELAIDLVEQSAPQASADLGSRPLITIGIYGPWGSGKSTLLRAVSSQMSATGFVTVHINTWKWDGNEDIYAFMNRELLRSLSKINGLRSRTYLLRALLKFRANLKRWGVWFAILVGAIVAAKTIDWKSVTTAGVARGTIAGVITGGVVAALAKPLVGLFEKALLIEPDNIDARQSLSKSYRYLELVRRFTRARRKGPIVFLFDDLDRCDNKIVVDFVRSIHSLTSDGSLCVVACDEEFAAAAIYSQYKQVADYLDEGKGFGKRFLEKIIQVPFRLPEVFKEDLKEIGLAPLPAETSAGQASAVGSIEPAELPTAIKDLGDKSPATAVSEARLWEICGNLLAVVIEPAGLEIRQAKMLSNIVKLYSMIFPPLDEVSANRLAAFLIVNYIDPEWIPSRHFGTPKKPSRLDSVETDLLNYLGNDDNALMRLYRTLGLRRGWLSMATAVTM